MEQLTNFENIFNRLIKDYQGKEVILDTGYQEFNLSRFNLTISSISIKAADPKTRKRWATKEKKPGLILIQEKKQNQNTTVARIPFLLGYHTMNAVFSPEGVVIKSMGFRFIIKKIKIKKATRKKGA